MNLLLSAICFVIFIFLFWFGKDESQKMIALKKSTKNIYSSIGIILLLIIGILQFYPLFIYIPDIFSVVGVGITILFTWGIENVNFKGRWGNNYSRLWILNLSLSFLILLLLFFITIIVVR
jgi:hypothetical protein